MGALARGLRQDALSAAHARDERLVVPVGRDDERELDARLRSGLAPPVWDLRPRGRGECALGLVAARRGRARDPGEPLRGLLPRVALRRRPRARRLQLGHVGARVRRLAVVRRGVRLRLRSHRESRASAGVDRRDGLGRRRGRQGRLGARAVRGSTALPEDRRCRLVHTLKERDWRATSSPEVAASFSASSETTPA